MRWSLLRNPESETAPEPLLPEAEIHATVGFNIVYNQIRDRKRLSVLDLGSAHAANLSFLSRSTRSLHMEIEDFYETLSSFDFFDPRESRSYDAVYQYLLPYSEDIRFDLILGWDLFNYLEELELASLIRHLEHFCQPGTLLFSMISTNRYVPEKPIRFQIVDSQRLRYEYLSSLLRPSPQYHYPDLIRIMPGFRLFSSFRLRNGFKEYVFSFDGRS
jgi:hypothetical protein